MTSSYHLIACIWVKGKDGSIQELMLLFRKKKNKIEKLCFKTQLQNADASVHVKGFPIKKENENVTTYDQEDSFEMLELFTSLKIDFLVQQNDHCIF